MRSKTVGGTDPPPDQLEQGEALVKLSVGHVNQLKNAATRKGQSLENWDFNEKALANLQVLYEKLKGIRRGTLLGWVHRAI